MRRSRSELTVEANAWISAVEALCQAKGMDLASYPGGTKGPTAGELCEGLGAGLMFYARARAKRPDAADELLGYFVPLIALLGLSLDDVRNLRPLGVA